MPRATTLPPVGPVPRQQRGIEKRRRVYEAALELYAERGVAETKVEDVVTAADVSWGTFFRYFPRKEDVLLEAGVEHVRTRLQPAVDKALDAGLPAKDVACDAFAAVVTSSRPAQLHFAILREIQSHPARFHEMFGEGMDPLIAQLVRVLSYGQGRGEVRVDVDPFTMAAILAAGVTFPLVQAALLTPGAPFDPLPAVERILDVVWRAVEG